MAVPVNSRGSRDERVASAAVFAVMLLGSAVSGHAQRATPISSARAGRISGTLRAVERIYGPAKPQIFADHPRFVTLGYGLAFAPFGAKYSDCTENHFFLFRDGALEGIDFTTVC